MFVIGNFLKAAAIVLDYLLFWLQIVIIVRALISWVNPDPYNFIVRLLHGITEPILAPFRRILPPYRIGLDLSPVLAILSIIFLREFLVKTLFRLAYQMQ